MTQEELSLRNRLAAAASDVAVILTADTGHLWYRVSREWDGHAAGAAVKDERGMQIDFGVAAHPKPRIALDLASQHDGRGQYLTVYKDGHRLPSPSITVSPDSTPQRIAQQIKSRLLADAEVYFTLAREMAAREDAHAKLTQESAQRFAEAAGAEVRQDTGGYREEFAVWTLDELWSVCGDTVRAQSFSLNIDEAVAVVKLLHAMRRQKAAQAEV